MSEELPRRTQRSTQMVNDALEDMHRRRVAYRRAKAVGAVTENIQTTFQSAVVTVYDELRPHKSRVKSEWEEYQLDRIHELAAAQMTNNVVDTTGGRVDHRQETVPYRIPCPQLLAWSHCFDDIARELGFASAVKDKTTRNKPSRSDLKGLLTDRGQFEAAENLPGGGSD